MANMVVAFATSLKSLLLLEDCFWSWDGGLRQGDGSDWASFWSQCFVNLTEVTNIVVDDKYRWILTHGLTKVLAESLDRGCLELFEASIANVELAKRAVVVVDILFAQKVFSADVTSWFSLDEGIRVDTAKPCHWMISWTSFRFPLQLQISFQLFNFRLQRINAVVWFLLRHLDHEIARRAQGSVFWAYFVMGFQILPEQLFWAFIALYFKVAALGVMLHCCFIG